MNFQLLLTTKVLHGFRGPADVRNDGQINPRRLVYGWDSMKILILYSSLSLSTLKNVKSYPTMPKTRQQRSDNGMAGLVVRDELLRLGDVARRFRV